MPSSLPPPFHSNLSCLPFVPILITCPPSVHACIRPCYHHLNQLSISISILLSDCLILSHHMAYVMHTSIHSSIRIIMGVDYLYCVIHPLPSPSSCRHDITYHHVIINSYIMASYHIISYLNHSIIVQSYAPCACSFLCIIRYHIVNHDIRSQRCTSIYSIWHARYTNGMNRLNQRTPSWYYSGVEMQ